jgi:hypothetical protein
VIPQQKTGKVGLYFYCVTVGNRVDAIPKSDSSKSCFQGFYPIVNTTAKKKSSKHKVPLVAAHFSDTSLEFKVKEKMLDFLKRKFGYSCKKHIQYEQTSVTYIGGNCDRTLFLQLSSEQFRT